MVESIKNHQVNKRSWKSCDATWQFGDVICVARWSWVGNHPSFSKQTHLSCEAPKGVDNLKSKQNSEFSLKKTYGTKWQTKKTNTSNETSELIYWTYILFVKFDTSTKKASWRGAFTHHQLWPSITRSLNKKQPSQVIQFVTFLSVIVGGHLSFEGHFFPSQKRSQRTGFPHVFLIWTCPCCC